VSARHDAVFLVLWNSGFLKVLMGAKPPFWPPPMAAAARIFENLFEE
jgi:hypothetical protein